MDTARFILTPYFEIMDVMVPLSRLHVDKDIPKENTKRVECRNMIEFCVRHDHSVLLSESRRQRNISFNVRCLMRFCKFDEIRCDKYGIKLKDVFPLHLQLNLNNTLVHLPNLLPNDRSGKDGRRFPRPVDLTREIIDNPIVTNRIIIDWVQDVSKNEEYYFAIYLVRLRSYEELSSLLLNQQLSTVTSTLTMVVDQCNNLNGAVDEDVMLVNSSICTSLNCPISRDRIKIPIRGQDCNHLQCFDCITFLIINFKKPTWQCPVCDKKTFYCYLEVDGLILSILNDDRSVSVENIQFNNSGQWRPQRKIPGCTEEDQPFYDVIEYLKQSRSPGSTNSTTSMILNESFNDHKADGDLKQIFSGSNAYMDMYSKLYQSQVNMSASNISATKPSIKCQDDSRSIRKNDIATLLSSDQNPVNLPSKYEHTQISKRLCNPISNNQCMHPQPGLAYNNSLVTQSHVPRFHHSYVPQPPPYDYQRTANTNIINDISSRLQITNVKSMAQHLKVPKDVIVLSDDDMDDANSAKKSIIFRKKSQKRLQTESTKTCSSKQMKLLSTTAPTSPMYVAPISTLLSDTNSNMKQFPQICKCTPERICPFHSEHLGYMNQSMANTLSNQPYPSRPAVPHSTSFDCNNVGNSDSNILNCGYKVKSDTAILCNNPITTFSSKPNNTHSTDISQNNLISQTPPINIARHPLAVHHDTYLDTMYDPHIDLLRQPSPHRHFNNKLLAEMYFGQNSQSSGSNHFNTSTMTNSSSLNIPRLPSYVPQGSSQNNNTPRSNLPPHSYVACNKSNDPQITISRDLKMQSIPIEILENYASSNMSNGVRSLQNMMHTISPSQISTNPFSQNDLRFEVNKNITSRSTPQRDGYQNIIQNSMASSHLNQWNNNVPVSSNMLNQLNPRPEIICPQSTPYMQSISAGDIYQPNVTMSPLLYQNGSIPNQRLVQPKLYMPHPHRLDVKAVPFRMSSTPYAPMMAPNINSYNRCPNSLNMFYNA